MDFQETFAAMIVAQQTLELLAAKAEELQKAGKQRKAEECLAQMEEITEKMAKLEAEFRRSKMN